MNPPSSYSSSSPRAFLLFLSLAALLLSLCATSVTVGTATIALDHDEDLSFLEDSDDSTPSHTHLDLPHDDDNDFNNDASHDFDDELGDLDDFEEPGDGYKAPEINEKDVVILKDGKFSDFMDKNRFVMVEFYVPWCGHCQALAPEYAAAATELKDSGEVLLAKVDAAEEEGLSQKYEVQGFPTIYFFVKGNHKPYNGQRTK